MTGSWQKDKGVLEKLRDRRLKEVDRLQKLEEEADA